MKKNISKLKYCFDLLDRIYFKVYRMLRKELKKITIPKISNHYEKKFNNDIQKFFKSLNLSIDIIEKKFEGKFYITLSDELKNFYIKNYPDEANHSIEIANKILKNDFTSFHPDFKVELTVNGQINWLIDFDSKKSWKLQHWSEIDISSDKRIGDVRINWELNRFQFLIDLGKAYFITEDEKYVEKFVELIESWIIQNPFGYGINWLHSQETAIRMVSWIWGYFFFKKSKILSENFKKKFLFSLYQHAYFTYYDLSIAYITHNHLISELAGLLIFSILFEDFPKCSNWRKKSKRTLEKQILKQFWQNGPSGETSTNYHLFSLDSIIECDILLKKNNDSFSNSVIERIEKIFEYAMYMIKPDGAIPLIGDNDSGRAIKLSSYTNNDKRHYLSIGSARFNNSEFKYVARKFYEEAFWLLGSKNYRHFETLIEKEPTKKIRFYPEIGILYARSDWNDEAEYFIFRSGAAKLKKGVSFGRSHSDYLSFLYSFKKTDFFIDPGVFTYSGGDKYRFYFRSSKAHNSIIVDNLNFFPINKSRFGLQEIALSEITDYRDANDKVFIGAKCSPLENKNIIIQRKVLFKCGKFIVICDKLSEKENSKNDKHNIETLFQIPADIEHMISKDKNLNIVLQKDDVKVFLYPVVNKRYDLNIIQGSYEPFEGWMAPRYNKMLPAKIACFNFQENFPATFIFIISFQKIENLFMDDDILCVDFDNESYKINLSIGTIVEKIKEENK